jgi:hypothetical protein
LFAADVQGDDVFLAAAGGQIAADGLGGDAAIWGHDPLDLSL